MNMALRGRQSKAKERKAKRETRITGLARQVPEGCYVVRCLCVGKRVERGHTKAFVCFVVNILTDSSFELTLFAPWVGCLIFIDDLVPRFVGRHFWVFSLAKYTSVTPSLISCFLNRPKQRKRMRSYIATWGVKRIIGYSPRGKARTVLYT